MSAGFGEWLAMSGYGSYVWSAVGLTLAVLVTHAIWAKRRLAATLAEARVLNDAPQAAPHAARARITETSGGSGS